MIGCEYTPADQSSFSSKSLHVKKIKLKKLNGRVKGLANLVLLNKLSINCYSFCMFELMQKPLERTHSATKLSR